MKTTPSCEAFCFSAVSSSKPVPLSNPKGLQWSGHLDISQDANAIRTHTRHYFIGHETTNAHRRHNTISSRRQAADPPTAVKAVWQKGTGRPGGKKADIEQFHDRMN